MVFRLMIITWFLFHIPMTWAGRNAARAITLTLGKEQLWGYLLVVLDYTTRTKSCRFCDPKLMTAETITRLRQKQWSPLQQLNCLTELQTKVLSFQFTQVMMTPQQRHTCEKK